MDIELPENSLVITKDNRKEELIETIRKSKKLLNVKVLGLSEFKKRYFFDYSKKTLFYVHKKHQVIVDIAKIYIENLYFIGEAPITNEKVEFLKRLKDDLEREGLLKEDKTFRDYVQKSHIVLYGLDYIDKFYQKTFRKLQEVTEVTKIGQNKSSSKKKELYKFSRKESEIAFIASRIVELIKKGIPIEKIKLANVEEDYVFSIRNIFRDFHIPVSFQTKDTLASTAILHKFKNSYSEDIDGVLKELYTEVQTRRDERVYEKIVKVINDYYWANSYSEVKDLIFEDLDRTVIPDESYKNVVEIVDFTDHEPVSDEYVFLLNFNQGIIPRTQKDEDFLDDALKNDLGISDSIDLNTKAIEEVRTAIRNCENLVVTYCDHDINGELYISNAYDEELFENRNPSIPFTDSDAYNKKILLIKEDEHLKYGIESSEYHILKSHYKDEPYRDYDNSFKGIDKKLLHTFLNNKLTLSYSSMNTFYKCSFRYYLEYILKLDKDRETIDRVVGNVFHKVLSEAFKDSFDFEESWANALFQNEFEFKKSDLFFLDILKKELIFIIDTIKESKKYTSLSDELFEQKIVVEIDKEKNVEFKGFVDKILFGQFRDDLIVAIVDYKTGSPELSIDNAVYGLDMQLPIYAYLIKNYEPFKNARIGGFYLQKILSNEKDEAKKKATLKLQGYSNSDISILEKVDNSYENSELIKSLKIGRDGFSRYSKILSDREIEKLSCLVDEKITEASKAVLEGEFSINPKEIGGKTNGCNFCKFKDICFMKNSDVVKLKNINREEFLGGESYADVD